LGVRRASIGPKGGVEDRRGRIPGDRIAKKRDDVVMRPSHASLAGLLALVLAAGCGSTRETAPAGAEIRGIVWSPECGVEPGVCKWVRAAQATVRGCLVTRDVCQRTRSGPDGTYQLRVSRPGHYRVLATKRAELGVYRTQARDVVARSGEASRLDLGRP
jgi:hypothetical protein